MISVLLPVKKFDKFVAQAIESVLSQTFDNWELIILFNESEQSECSTLREKYLSEKRIKFTPIIESNLPSTLNHGIVLSQGKYIVRFDADDIMCSNRLSHQFNFMEKNLSYVVCGGQVRLIDNFNEKMEIHPKYFISNYFIKKNLDWKCPFAHPAVIIRKDAILKVGGYNTNLPLAEDVDLWYRLAGIGKFHNLKKCVILYRQHENQISKIKMYETMLYSSVAYLDYLSNYKYTQKNEIDLHKWSIDVLQKLKLTKKYKFVGIYPEQFTKLEKNSNLILARRFIFNQFGINSIVSKIVIFKYYKYRCYLGFKSYLENLIWQTQDVSRRVYCSIKDYN